MKKLTIGIFLEHYDPFISGVISSVKSLREELIRQGHTVYIVCPSAGAYKDNDPGIIRIPSFSTRSLENTTIGIPNPISKHKINRIRFDIIHSQEVFFTSVLGMQIARAQNIPYIQTYHTLWDKFLEQYKMQRRVIAFGSLSIAIFYPFVFGFDKLTQLFKKDARTNSETKLTARFMWRHMMVLAGAADYVIVPSHHLKQAILSCGSKTEIAVVPNSIPPIDISDMGPILPPRSKRLRVLCVARLSPEKRIDTLLQAIKLQGANAVELFIIGEGPYEDYLKGMTKKLKVQNRVTYMGMMDNKSTRKAMTEVDILALASYDFDNQPMVFNEAFDAGLPIIYCDPRLGEGLNEQNSLLVDNSPQGFAGGINTLSSAKLRAKMAEASKKAAPAHSAKVAANQTLNIYKVAIKEYETTERH